MLHSPGSYKLPVKIRRSFQSYRAGECQAKIKFCSWVVASMVYKILPPFPFYNRERYEYVFKGYAFYLLLKLSNDHARNKNRLFTCYYNSIIEVSKPMHLGKRVGFCRAVFFNSFNFFISNPLGYVIYQQ